MRPREVWFYLGGGFLTAGSVLTAVAIAYYTKEENYSLSSGPQMIAAYVVFILAFSCFFAAIAGWRPWLIWQRFPDVIVRVDGVGEEIASVQIPEFPPRPTRFSIVKIHFSNAESDRSVTIRAVYFLTRATPGTPFYEDIYTAPHWAVSYRRPIEILKFPLNLAPQETVGGFLVFEMEAIESGGLPLNGDDGRFEIHDAVSGKMASFPGSIGIYRRHHGLRETSLEERVTGPKAVEPWFSVMGPPDRGSGKLMAPREHQEANT